VWSFFTEAARFMEMPRKCFHESLKHISFFLSLRSRHRNGFYIYISKSSLWKKIYGLGGVRMEIYFIYLAGWMRGARAVRAMEVCCAARNGMKSTAGASFLLTTFCTLAGM
jgi:hypothetical protein